MQKSTSGKRKCDTLLTEKFCKRLVTCSFDQSFLQQPPGFLAAVSGRINCTNPVNGKSTNAQLPDWVVNPPPLVQPLGSNTGGPQGPVPLPMSISWQRHSPFSDSDSVVHLTVAEESDVLVIVPQKQLLNLLSDKSELSNFISSIVSLRRKVSVVFFEPRVQTAKQTALLDLAARLQFDANVLGIQQVSNVQNLAILVANYTKAISQRPFKENRTEDRNGFSFLPSTATLGAGGPSGSAGAFRFPRTLLSTATMEQSTAVRAWVHRTWLRQLSTWRGLTGEVAHAIATQYPTPRILYDAFKDGSVSASQLADLPIRRGAGVLATQNRLGAPLANRIATFFMSVDPDDLGAS